MFIYKSLPVFVTTHKFRGNIIYYLVSENNIMPKNISSTINPQVIDDIDSLVSKGHYRNRSHAIEEGLKKILAEQTS